MAFWVKLIEVSGTKDQDARDSLQSNCTHVGSDYWLFEGDEIGLDEGIDFDVVGEQVISGYGDLTGLEIKKMVIDVYNIDAFFL